MPLTASYIPEHQWPSPPMGKKDGRPCMPHLYNFVERERHQRVLSVSLYVCFNKKKTGGAVRQVERKEGRVSEAVRERESETGGKRGIVVVL